MTRKRKTTRKVGCKAPAKVVKCKTPFWENYGYSAQEWKLRQSFERSGNNDFMYSAYEDDFNVFEI